MAAAEYAKAIIGGALAGLTALGTALADGAVSGQEWVGVAVATLGVLAGVYGVANRPPAARGGPDGRGK